MADLYDLSWVEEEILREELYREIEEQQSEDGEPRPSMPPSYHETSGLPLDPDGSLPFSYGVMDDG